jgi:phage shock protein A
MPIPEDSKLQKIKKQIETWNNRAAMARQMGNGDLEQQALDRKKESENALAQLQEFELE